MKIPIVKLNSFAQSVAKLITGVQPMPLQAGKYFKLRFEPNDCLHDGEWAVTWVCTLVEHRWKNFCMKCKRHTIDLGPKIVF